MKLSNQEKHIKQKMAAFKPPVDKEALWDALADKVPKQKRKNRFYFLLWIFPITGLIIGSYYYLKHDASDDEDAIEIESRVSDNELEIAGMAKEKIEKPDQLDINGYDRKEGRNIEVVKDQMIADSKVKMNLNSSIFSPKQNLESNKNNLKKEAITTDHLDKRESRIKYDAIGKMAKGIKTSFQRNFQLTAPKVQHRGLGIGAINRRGHLSFVFMFGMGQAKLAYLASNTHEDEFCSYINEISQAKEVLGASTEIKYNIGRNLYLTSGINWTRYVNEYFPDWERISTQEVKSLSGASQWITKDTRYKAKGYLYHHSFDLPLKLGIYLFKRENWQLGLEPGIYLNIYRSSFGKFLGADRKLQSLRENIEHPYNDNFNFGYSLSLLLERRIIDQWNMIFKPQYEMRSIGYTINNSSMTETNHNFQLKMGMIYNF